MNNVHRKPEAIFEPADASTQDKVHVQLLVNLRKVQLAGFKTKRRIACQDTDTHSAQRRAQFFSQTVGEVIVLLVFTKVFEGQDHNEIRRFRFAKIESARPCGPRESNDEAYSNGRRRQLQ